MLIKQKSLVVALISGFVVSLVLVLTVIGHLVYIELRAERLKHSYADLFAKVNSKVYSKHIEISKLSVRLGEGSPVKDKPIVEGLIRNNGTRNITNMAVRIKFLNKDGAVIYEAEFRPHEPLFGRSTFARVSIPYLSAGPKLILKAGEALPFKRILQDCPKEIFASGNGKWNGRLGCELVSIEF
jgi:hypothetical protein